MIAWLLASALASAADLAWSADLEADDGGFLSYGETAQWEWGEVVSGPGAGFDGTYAWGTQLTRWYLNDTTDHLRLPAVDLAGMARPVLGFQHWYSFQAGDFGWVEVERDGVWTPQEPVYGYPAAEGFGGHGEAWSAVWVDLSGLDSAERVRLTFSSDASGAAAGWFVDAFRIWDGDPVPPDVRLDGCLPDTEDVAGPYTVQATIRDDTALASADLLYQVDGGMVRLVPMEAQGGDLWAAGIPGQPPGSAVSYTVLATDAENQTLTPDPACAFSVALPPPTGLRGPSGLVWGITTGLDWIPPESSHTVQGYRVWRDGVLVAEVEPPRVEAPLVSGSQTFEVSAIFDVGDGERGEGLVVEAAVPTVLGLVPAEGYQGDHLRLELRGEYLLMDQADLEVDLGPHVRVTDLCVRDVDLAWVTVFIASNAPAGSVDLALLTGGQRVVVPAAFELLPGADRPRLVSLEPASAAQGDEVDVLIGASMPFASVPAVWLGEDLVVERADLDGEGRVLVHAVVPADAAVGLHAVEVDDGTRIFGGMAFRVRGRLADVAPGRRCGAVSGQPALALPALGALLLAFRRRRYRLRSRPPSTGRLTPRT